MILGFIQCEPTCTDTQIWINGMISMMEMTYDIGAKIYPLLAGLGLLRTLGAIL